MRHRAGAAEEPAFHVLREALPRRRHGRLSLRADQRALAARSPAASSRGAARSRPVAFRPAQPMKGPIALTGSTGFVGRHLATALAEAGFALRLLVRQAPQDCGFGSAETVTGSL